VRKLAVALSTILVVALLGPADAPAADSAGVCNQSATGMWVAFGYPGGDELGWVTTGWWWAEPNECTGRVPLLADVAEIWVYANSAERDVEWRGTKSLCVSLDAFENTHAESGECDVSLPFRKYGEGPTGDLDVILGDGEATRVAYDFTLCNATDDAVTAVVGNVPEEGGGISTDGWYAIASRECETFVRRGRWDHAYFFAQAPARRLVWRGETALCTRYHEGFTLAGADSGACDDGDAERLPFVKVPLVDGRGSYELNADKARVFKSGLSLCNGYASDVYAAVAHLDTLWTSGNVARGYWRLHPGECRFVDAVASGPVYVYGETAARDKLWSGNDLAGCVGDEFFTFATVDRRPCKGAGERRAGFLKWSVSEGANVYEFE
jgi:uncharacterized membrane protein